MLMALSPVHRAANGAKNKERRMCGPARARDDSNEHIVYCLGNGLCSGPRCPNERYKTLTDLGEGTFGKVVET